MASGLLMPGRLPQHTTPLPAVSAHEAVVPLAMATAPVRGPMGVTSTGTASAELVLTASFPSCPFASLPQQYTWVSCPRAQLWNSPTLMATAGEGTDTKMGLAESPATLPSWN